MSYQALAASGAAVTVKPTDLISSIAGEPFELYVTDVKPLPVGGVVPTLMATEQAVISPVTYSGGTVTPGTSNTFKSQVHFFKTRRHGEDRIPDGPETRGYLIVRSADAGITSKLLEISFADVLSGKAFLNNYAFARVSVAYSGGDPDAGDPGVATPTSTAIPYLDIDLSEQYEDDGPTRNKVGDALILVDRSAVSKAQLESAEYFTVTPQGESAQRYVLWNTRGVRTLKTFQYAIYLQRQKQ
jgi:hypothetical protein